MRKFKILLTNDDGYTAEGIRALYKVLKDEYDIYLVAPETEQSGFSHKITLKIPLHLQKISKSGCEGFKLNGTPTDCVKLALQNLYKGEIDLVLSGINRGSNNGISVHYSGTVAAIVEGKFYGKAGVAVSLFSYTDEKFDTAAEFIKKFLDKHIETIVERGSLLNINIPDLESYSFDNISYCNQGLCNFNGDYRFIEHLGRQFYWADGPEKEVDPKRFDDDSEILKNRITITPLKVDLTDYEELEYWKR